MLMWKNLDHKYSGVFPNYPMRRHLWNSNLYQSSNNDVAKTSHTRRHLGAIQIIRGGGVNNVSHLLFSFLKHCFFKAPGSEKFSLTARIGIKRYFLSYQFAYLSKKSVIKKVWKKHRGGGRKSANKVSLIICITPYDNPISFCCGTEATRY